MIDSIVQKMLTMAAVIAVAGGCAIQFPDQQLADDQVAEVLPEQYTQKKIDADQGGEIEITEDGPLKGAKIIIPAGALSEDTIITIESVRSEPGPNSGSQVEAGPAVQFGPSGLQFKIPVEIQLPVDTALLQGPGLTISQAYVHYYNPESEVWETQRQSSVGENSVGAEVSHFSLYKVFGLTVEAFADETIVDSIKLTPSSRSMLTDTTFRFGAKAYSASGAEIEEGVTISWSSDNTAVASVAQDGSATAITLGTATIKASAGGRFATAVVTVLNELESGGNRTELTDIYVADDEYWSSGYGHSAACDENESDPNYPYCADGHTVYAFESDLDSSGLVVRGKYLFEQDGPDNGTQTQLVVATNTGTQTIFAESWSDDSDPEEPLTEQIVFFSLPTNLIDGTATLQTPNRNIPIDLRVWRKPVITFIDEEAVAGCLVDANVDGLVFGANLESATVSIGGTQQTITYELDFALDFEFETGTQSGSIVATNAHGDSTDWDAISGDPSPTFERLEGPVTLYISPTMVTNQSEITIYGCAFGSSATVGTVDLDYTGPATGVPHTLSELQSLISAPTVLATSSTYVTIAAPSNPAALAVSMPNDSWSDFLTISKGLKVVGSSETLLPMIGSNGQHLVWLDTVPGCDLFECDDRIVVHRIDNGGNEVTAVAQLDSPIDAAHYLFGAIRREEGIKIVDATTLLVSRAGESFSEMALEHWNIDWIGSVVTRSVLFEPEDANIDGIAFSDTDAFVAIEGSFPDYGIDIFKVPLDNSGVPVFLGSTDYGCGLSGQLVSVVGSKLVFGGEQVGSSECEVKALDVTSNSLSNAVALTVNGSALIENVFALPMMNGAGLYLYYSVKDHNVDPPLELSVDNIIVQVAPGATTGGIVSTATDEYVDSSDRYDSYLRPMAINGDSIYFYHEIEVDLSLQSDFSAANEALVITKRPISSDQLSIEWVGPTNQYVRSSQFAYPLGNDLVVAVESSDMHLHDLVYDLFGDLISSEIFGFKLVRF